MDEEDTVGAKSRLPKRKSVKHVVVGAPKDVPGRLVITDPGQRRRISPPLSSDALRKIEALEQASAHAMIRLRHMRYG